MNERPLFSVNRCIPAAEPLLISANTPHYKTGAPRSSRTSYPTLSSVFFRNLLEVLDLAFQTYHLVYRKHKRDAGAGLFELTRLVDG